MRTLGGLGACLAVGWTNAAMVEVEMAAVGLVRLDVPSRATFRHWIWKDRRCLDYLTFLIRLHAELARGLGTFHDLAGWGKAGGCMDGSGRWNGTLMSMSMDAGGR